MSMQFSKRQLANWRRFERVRAGGEFNMYFPEARRAARLSETDYSFTMLHYTELKEAAEQRKHASNNPSPFEDEANGKGRE